MAYHDHPHVSIEDGDTVIISAKPVPGNELRVHDTINRLAKSGAEVLHQEIAPVHVSGHGNAEEIRTILAVLRPRNVMPVHGEFRMLAAQARLARDAGVPADRIVLAENGSVVELRGGIARLTDQLGVGSTFVDGLGVGDVKDVAPRPPTPVRGRRPHRRRHVGFQNGGEIAAPEVISRGFAETDSVWKRRSSRRSARSRSACARTCAS